MSGRKPTRAKGLGVTDEQYAARLEAQGGGCAICGTTPKTRRLNVDHDHRSRDHVVRGLLDHRCNRALPSWITPEWLLAAALYLHDHSDVEDTAEPWQYIRDYLHCAEWPGVFGRWGKIE